MKHRKKLMILLTLTACMVLFCSFPVFAAELTEAQVEQAVAEQGKETVTDPVTLTGLWNGTVDIPKKTPSPILT